MHIYKENKYSNSLDNILDYIALDSLNRSKQFNRQLQKEIYTLPNMPYKFRKSHYYNDENVRDMIFKGYTIPYLINIEHDSILLLDIFKWVKK